MSSPTSPDPKKEESDVWHRRFAVEANNLGWDLAELPSRTADEARQLVHAAHTAAYHWAIVGKPLNNARAKMLLAKAHLLSGDAALAAGYAREVIDFCETSAEIARWDLAFAHALMAQAAAAVGDPAGLARHAEAARACRGTLQHAEETALFEAELAKIPGVWNG